MKDFILFILSLSIIGFSIFGAVVGLRKQYEISSFCFAVTTMCYAIDGIIRKYWNEKER